MRCSKARTFLTDYRNGRVEPHLKEQLDSHLNLCRDCAKELEFLETYLPATASVAKTGASPLFVENLMRKIEHTTPKPFRRIVMVPAALTSVIMILLIAFYIYQPLKPGSLQGAGEEPAPYQVKNAQQPTAQKESPVNTQDTVKVAINRGESQNQMATNTQHEMGTVVLLTLAINSPVSGNDTWIPTGQSKSMELNKTTRNVMEDTSGGPQAETTEPQSKKGMDDSLELENLTVRISDIAKSLGGMLINRVESSIPVASSAEGTEWKIMIRLPYRNYQQLVTELKRLGELADLSPQLPARDSGILEVCVTIKP